MKTVTGRQTVTTRQAIATLTLRAIALQLVKHVQLIPIAVLTIASKEKDTVKISSWICSKSGLLT